MNLKGIAIAPHPPVIIPEVGCGREIQAEKTVKGLKQIAKKIAQIKPDTIVCITPHGNLFRDGISVLYDATLTGDLGAFCPDEASKEKTTITKTCDTELLDELRLRWNKNDCRSLFINTGIAEERDLTMALDHGVLVPLYFIDRLYSNYKIVHITVSGLSLLEHYRMGRILREAVEIGNRRTVILSCADLSHYHRHDEDYSPMSERFDELMVKNTEEGNFYELLTMDAAIYEPAGQCGLRPMIMALGATDSIKTQTEVFGYEAPYGVGYMTAFVEYDLTNDDPITESLLERYIKDQNARYDKRKESADCVARLALESIEYWVKNGKQYDVDMYLTAHRGEEEYDELLGCAGAFVTILKSGELRGCIGTINGVTENIAKEIVRNSIQAAGYDPRFMPVEEEELAYLDVEVSILYDFESVEDMEELEPKKYGIIAEKDMQRGLLLPDLPGIDSAEKQVAFVKEKAGIIDSNDEWEEKVYLTRFKTRKHTTKNVSSQK